MRRARMLVLSVSIVVGAAESARGELPAPGTLVTAENMQRYEEALFPSMQYMLRNGMEIPVVEYQKFEWPKAYRAATEKFSNQVDLSPDRRELINYVAGSPFPTIDPNDPEAGTKWMWNHEQKMVYTDNFGAGWNMELINAKGERERFFTSNFYRRMFWRGRLNLEPMPVAPHDPAIIYTEQWGPMNDPSDLKGAGILNFRYADPDVADDSYMYLPELRKVRRLSMANRSDAFWGTDIDIDSMWGFNSKPSYWTFKFLGQRKLLQAVRSGGYGQREAWCAQPDGQSELRSFFWCVPHEVRDVIVVEGVPSGFQQYAFSKRIIYIDRESYMSSHNEGYDHGGQLWRSWYMMSDTGKTPHEIQRTASGAIERVPTQMVGASRYEEEHVFPGHGGVIDHQLNHVSHWDGPDAYLYPTIPEVQHEYHNTEKPWNTIDNFTINYLIKSAGF